MRRLFEAAVSMLIAVSLVVCSASFAIAGSGCDCGFAPVVYVGPLGSATLYLDADTDGERVLFRPTDETVMSLVTELVPAAARLAVTKDYDAFGTSLIDAVRGAFGALAMDESGDSSPRVSTKTALPDSSEHGRGRDYYFGYDFRADPFDTAERLSLFIGRVRELTGHDKVILKASSMGGIMAMAYLERCGTRYVESCVFQCCPISGTAVAGELLSGKIRLDADALVRYAAQAVPREFPMSLLSPLVTALDASGVVRLLVAAGDRIIEELGGRVYDELLIPIFGSMPGIWSFVPHADYEAAKELVFAGARSGRMEARIDDYHYNVQCRARDILRRAEDDGVRLMLVAGYNMQRTPLVESMDSDSDATVDTRYASVGAAVAPLGGSLAEGYVQAVDDGHSHLSPDRRIDASTCALPESTWFVKDMLHCNTHADFRELYDRFMYSGGEFNVFSDPAYPQFLQNDDFAEKLTPLTAQDAPGGLAARLAQAFLELLAPLCSLLRSILPLVK